MMVRSRSEGLKVVFALTRDGGGDAKSLGDKGIKFDEQKGEISPLEAFLSILRVMEERSVVKEFKEAGKAVSCASILSRLEAGGRWAKLRVTDLIFQYAIVGSHGHGFLTVQEAKPGAAGLWDDWVVPFLDKTGFVQAWVYDVDYDRWQNVKDPIEYEIAGKDYAGLPMKSNGLPPPLEKLEIDISRNPGRWILREGYVEAVGSTMWVSELFWRNVNRSKECVLKSLQNVSLAKISSEIVKIESSADCCFDESTRSEQDLLRNKLYGSDG
ncbi:hypothetical protein [Ralstonia solanacearum]|uniref:hypothetical protein n=1 Tax=Ralstonia solanacearum TaxID=305 RepID=UPI0012D39A2A|nr:hypothetical protein [Ralstonia solanacearum]MDC6180563.1 hypothetical protein [Ralstonia solanacearum]MDC6242133.1 hypothetical protein [Ralstonia solanacearum]